LNEHLAALEAVKRKTKAQPEPQTPEQMEMIERRLEQALDEVRARKADLGSKSLEKKKIRDRSR